MSPPAAVGVALHPVEGYLAAIEGVAGRLSLGRRVWDGPVDAVWPAASRAIVRSANRWQLLELNQEMAVSRVVDLGEPDWSAPVWNARGSAWLACSESTERCGIYRAEDGFQTQEIRLAGRLRALGLADDGVRALLHQDERAVLWNDGEALIPVIEGEGLWGAFAPGGARFAVIDSAGALVLGDVRSTRLTQVEAPIGAVGLLWSGESLFSVHRSGEIRRWDERGESISSLQCECQPEGAWAAGQGMVRLHDSLKQISQFLDFARGEGAFSILPASVSEVQ